MKIVVCLGLYSPQYCTITAKFGRRKESRAHTGDGIKQKISSRRLVSANRSRVSICVTNFWPWLAALSYDRSKFRCYVLGLYYALAYCIGKCPKLPTLEPRALRMGYGQCCDLETMVSRLECTRVHFVQVSVLVSRPRIDFQLIGEHSTDCTDVTLYRVKTVLFIKILSCLVLNVHEGLGFET